MAPNLMASAFYISGLVYAQQSVINPVTWTLEIEVQFYLLVPILTLLFAIREKLARRLAMIALGYAFIIGQILFVEHGSVWTFTIIHYLQYFLAGFLLADVYLCEWGEKAGHDWKWDIAAIAAVLPFLHSISDRAGIMRMLIPVMLFVFCFAVFRGVVLRAVLTRPLVVTIGGMCYSLYLIHYQLIATVRHFIHVPSTNSFSIDLLLQLLVIAPILLLVSTVYFALIEKPCMRPMWASHSIPDSPRS
jgi:peptidoglycan/LPS O-acetylase OafA/YrhL